MKRRRDWLAGLTVGAWAGFLLVYFPALGTVLSIAFLIPAAIRRSLEAMGGLLAGAGAVILLMLALANSNCRTGCTPPDLTGFVVTGCAITAVGGVISARSISASRG